MVERCFKTKLALRHKSAIITWKQMDCPKGAKHHQNLNKEVPDHWACCQPFSYIKKMPFLIPLSHASYNLFIFIPLSISELFLKQKPVVGQKKNKENLFMLVFSRSIKILSQKDSTVITLNHPSICLPAKELYIIVCPATARSLGKISLLLSFLHNDWLNLKMGKKG